MADFDFDLFLSYSTLDNHYGWVTDFVEHLRASLHAAVGIREPQRIWWDRTNIDENLPLTAQIRNQVTRSRLLVVLLSPGYCKSQWCREERETFLRQFPRARDEGRVVLVDLGTLGRDNRPPEFGDLRGSHFFLPSPTDPDRGEMLGFPKPDIREPTHRKFFTAVDELARSLVPQLATAATPHAPAIPHPGIQEAGATLCLEAETSLSVCPRKDPC